VQVQASAIAGPGLTPGTGCQVQVNPGCGTEVVAGQLRVKRADLLGLGLEAGAGTCDIKLKLAPSSCLILDSNGLKVDSSCLVGDVITPGCGVEFAAGLLRVKNTDLVGAGGGLKALGTCGLGIDVDCGVMLLNGKLRVDPVAIAGEGLEPVGGSSCGVRVKVGCGLLNTSDEIRVNNAAIAGLGLVPGTGCSVNINPGCGTEIVSGQLRVKASDLVGAGGGLKTIGTCGLGIDVDCGVLLLNGKLRVDAVAIAGDGLEPVGGSSCGVRVKTGCGLSNSSDTVSVNRNDLLGPGLEPHSGTCNMKVALGSCLVFDGNNRIAVDVACLGGQVVTAGCGVNVVNGQVSFKPSDVAGLGLVPGAGCTIDVGVGCGLIRTANDISVDAAAIAGVGLKPAGSGCKVDINTQITQSFTAHRKISCRFEVDTANNVVRLFETLVPVIISRNAQLIPIHITEGFPAEQLMCTIPIGPCPA
jgi:hypothetical protein